MVERFAQTSLAALFGEYGASGRRLLGAAVVVGSQVDPATIKNEHIRAHAEEGRLFRTVVTDAAARAGLTITVVAEKAVYDEASKVLQRPASQLKSDIIALGRGFAGTWRAEEKTAALAAWMTLAYRS